MELQILNAIQTLRNPVLDQVMCGITKLGNAGVLWILLTAILLLIPKTRKSGMILAAALVVDVILCNGILKHLVARTRPCDVNTAIRLLIARPHDFSFPSGHTAASFAAVTALYLADEKKLWKISCVVAVLIAFSRLYLYVHYPTDVLGGLAVGILSGMAGYYGIRWMKAQWEQKV
ncbi:PAP2 family protein [Dorea sp. OM02-2LB]|jgi:membrane-associated phospholipid phosphatase|nr:PAP2 family protein [Dorea sp. OM02-2LB]RGV95764.1 PAP2 family protein [Ruminococcus sp. AF14-10]